MSTINIVDHNETIYNLVRRPLPPEDKFPKYQSKFYYMVRHKFVKPKRDHQTMGYAEIPLDPPNNFLKRHVDFTIRPQLEKDPNYPRVLGRPDAKPKKKPRTVFDEVRSKQLTQQRVEKNYEQANIQNVIRSVPRRPVVQIVDTVNGDTQVLETSGLTPKYIFREGYGKTPEYLMKRIEEEKLRSQGEQRAQIVKPILRLVSEEERQNLLKGLKTNWLELQTTFQGLPMLIDTVPKMKRKECLERELRQLEKDIACVERNPIIYVDEGAGDCEGIGDNNYRTC